MSSKTGAELLSERLGTDTRQASLLLDRFAAGMAAVLLGSGRLAIEGLGAFSVAHDRAAWRATGNGTVFMPPKERIAFEFRQASQGDASRIAVERLGMDAGESAGFTKALVAVFSQLRTRGDGLELRGFGSFAAERGGWTFTPDRGLEELLNGLYEGLDGIEMPDRAVSVPGKGNLLKAAGIGLAVFLLCVVGFFAWGRLPSFGGGSPDPAGRNASAATAQAEAASTSQVPVQPDSVVLAKGRYTVIAATFSSLKTAKAEARRLSAIGHRIMVWPVRDDGRRYYRLVTGDFPKYSEALDSVRAMPRGLSKNVYIQQAYKNVVIYGEQGL